MPGSSIGFSTCPSMCCLCPTTDATEVAQAMRSAGTKTPKKGKGGSVLLSSGMFTFHLDLMAISAVNNVSWSFSLDYLAGNGVDDIVGKCFTYPQYLRIVGIPGGHNVQLVTGENCVATFISSDGLAFTVPTPNTNNTRAELSFDGTYFTLRASNGAVSTFYGLAASTPGRVKQIVDRFGNTESYSWVSVGSVSQLVSETDSYGRTVNYSYFGPEFGYRLPQITDFLGRQLSFQYDSLGHLVAIIMPSIMQAAAGNTFPGGTAYVFQWDVNNPRPERQDDLVRIWYPNEATPFIDTAARTVDVAAVYASATPRYTVTYGQDPTNSNAWGLVTNETIGDPANGVGGTFQYLYDNAPSVSTPFSSDPLSTVVFQCVVTDRNDNQKVYNFNIQQMPVGVETLPSRNKITLASVTPPAGYIDWTQFNSQNQPLVMIFPNGNSVVCTYEDGTGTGLSGIYNRRAGLLISRTELAENTFGVPVPVENYGPSNGQSRLTEKFFYEPVYNQQCAVIERRGNPIDIVGGSDVYFMPQNPPYLPPMTPPPTPQQFFAQRYVTYVNYDFQKEAASTVEMDTILLGNLGLTGPELDSLYSYVNGQFTAAGLPGLPGYLTGLGDVNGDGTGSGTSNSAPHLGNVVQVQRPTVNLINPDPNSGLSTQARVEAFTSNSQGQVTTGTGPNGNLFIIVRYPYNDPEGNGGATATGLSAKQYGRIKEIHVDADPNDVLSLVGGDGDLNDFIPANTGITRYNTPGAYQKLVTRFEGGSGASGSGCSGCGYDPMGNPLARTTPRGFTWRFDRNELGEAYRIISPQPYNFVVEIYFDANRNVVRIDTQDFQPAFQSADPASAGFGHFSPSGSGFTAHVPMQPGPGGSVRPGWFTDLFFFDILDNKVKDDVDATGSTPANLITQYLRDPNENVIAVVKPEGNMVEFDHDERDLVIAVRIGGVSAAVAPPVGPPPSDPATPAVFITARDANGNLLEIIGPIVHAGGGSSDAATIEDAFRSGATVTYTGDRLLLNTIDGFDRVIQALDPLGNYVDTGVGFTGANPFLDPDGRVTQMDNYGTLGDGTSTIHPLASKLMRFDEGGRQYEIQRQVFIGGGRNPVSGRAVSHTGGGLEYNSTMNGNIAEVTLTTGGSSYVLFRRLFDAGDRVIRILDDLVTGGTPATTQIDYDGADRDIQIKDALGNILNRYFDADGNLVFTKRTDLCTVGDSVAAEVFAAAMFYDCLGQMVLRAVQGADGTLNSNILGLVKSAPFWAQTEWSMSTPTLINCLGYDSRGNGVIAVDPKGNSVVTVVDGASRAFQWQQHLRYRGQGDNPPPHNRTLLPGSEGTIVTTRLLDGNGRGYQLIDDRGAITLVAHDTFDRPTETTFHDGSRETNVYSQASEIIGFTDCNGSVLANIFDALSRKLSMNVTSFAAGVSQNTSGQSFLWDGLSRLTNAQNTNSDGSILSIVALYWDSLSRVLEDSQKLETTLGTNTRNATNTGFTSYAPTQFTFPAGRAINNTIDPLYRRTAISEATGGATLAAWNFIGADRVAEMQLGTSLVCTWMNNARTRTAVQALLASPAWGDVSSDRLGYDGAGRAITKRFLAGAIPESGGYSNTTSVLGFTTGFDRASNKFYERPLHAENRASLYEPFDSNGLPTGGYDSLDPLLQYQRGTLSSTGGDGGNGGGSIPTGEPITLPGTDAVRTFDLDPLGNWKNTAFTPVGGSAQTEVRQHNGLNEITRISNPPTTATPVVPTYDLNGNLLTDGLRKLQWDVLNRLANAKKADGTDIGDYFLDALNRRIRKTVSNGGLPGDIPNGTTDCIYLGWRCMEDRNPFGGEGSMDTALMQYLWGIYLDELIQVLPLMAVNGFAANLPLYPMQDLLYRTTGLLDSSSVNVEEAYDMDAYGNTLIFRNTTGGVLEPINWTDDTQVSSPTCPFIFTGQRFDAETGLYYYKRRYYSPDFGRFINRDPITLVGAEVNSFLFVGGRILIGTDPIGLAWAWAFGALKAAGGVFEIASGVGFAVATGWSGVGAVGGGLVALHGLDTLVAGLREAVSDKPVDSLTCYGLKKAGFSPRAAVLTDAAISVVGSLGAGTATALIKVLTQARSAEAAGMSLWQVFLAIEKGSTAYPNSVYGALGGATTSAVQKAAIIESGAVPGAKGLHLLKAARLAGTGPSPGANALMGGAGAAATGTAGGYNCPPKQPKPAAPAPKVATRIFRTSPRWAAWIDNLIDQAEVEKAAGTALPHSNLFYTNRWKVWYRDGVAIQRALVDEDENVVGDLVPLSGN
jgi:RHS repeat-associated protein